MRRFLFPALLLSVACYAGQQSACETGSGPTPIPSPSPVVIVIQPSPSPSASPTATPESCRIDYLTLRPVDGLILGNHEEATLDLTAYQTVTEGGRVSQVEVSKACNEPRTASLSWQSSLPSVGFISTGWNPVIRRNGVGFATITATLEGKVSNAITVRTP